MSSERPAAAGHLRRAGQVLDRVALGDRLGAVVAPGGHRQHPQALHQPDQHPEGGRAGADHDRGAQRGRRGRRLQQDLLDLEPRGEVRRGRPVRGRDPAQVDHPLDSRLARRPAAKFSRGAAVAGGEVVVVRGLHRVDEVVGHGAARRAPRARPGRCSTSPVDGLDAVAAAPAARRHAPSARTGRPSAQQPARPAGRPRTRSRRSRAPWLS